MLKLAQYIFLYTFINVMGTKKMNGFSCYWFWILNFSKWGFSSITLQSLHCLYKVMTSGGHDTSRPALNLRYCDHMLIRAYLFSQNLHTYWTGLGGPDSYSRFRHYFIGFVAMKIINTSIQVFFCHWIHMHSCLGKSHGERLSSTIQRHGCKGELVNVSVSVQFLYRGLQGSSSLKQLKRPAKLNIHALFSIFTLYLTIT